MTRWALTAALLLVAALGARAAAQALDQSAPDCVEVRAEPFLGAYGTNHAVRVTNRCERPVRCLVATDVDPEPQHRLRVPPGQSVLASTRLESPARAFAPLYHCELD